MNKQIPYYDVIMKANTIKDLQPLPLPTGYTYKNFTDGDEKHWVKLECEVDEFHCEEDAYAYFNRVFKPYPEQLKERMYFILDEKQNYVATASAWFKDDATRHYALVHWVSVSPTQQGKGLGKAIFHYVLYKFAQVEANETEIFLHTQTWSYKAIGLYGKYGFRITHTPLLKQTTNWECIPVLKTVLDNDVVDALIETN